MSRKIITMVVTLALLAVQAAYMKAALLYAGGWGQTLAL